MGVVAWRRRKTRHFGEQWVPFAELSIKSAHGRWQPFAMQVDTGAVITLLPRSAASFLGLNAAHGDPIELGSVGGYAGKYFVHSVEARIGEDLAPFSMRVALSENDGVPSLLGRLDVLDRVNIELDPSFEWTHFRPRLLNEMDQKVWRRLETIGAHLVSRWKDDPLPGRADEAARRIANRSDQLLTVAMTLSKFGMEFELPLVLRAQFELAVQFEYLMLDPERRAEQYLEFEHVTRWKHAEAHLRAPGRGGDILRNSPRRAEGEARLRQEFERVKHAYLTNKGNPRSHWYPYQLKQLADQLGRTTEYETVYSVFSDWAHGGPDSTGSLEIPHMGLAHSKGYWAQIWIRVADSKKIILPAEDYEILQVLAKPITEK